DLAWVDVLPAPDHHVLEPAYDLEVALLVHGAEVPRVVPAVLVEGGMGGRGIVVIAFHDAVAAGADLADLAKRDDLAGLGIDELELGVREGPADRGDPALERVPGCRHRDAGARLGLAVDDHDLAHVHPGIDFLHDLDRAGGTGHDPRAEGPQVVLREVRMRELGNEHGRDAVECRAALFFDSFQHFLGIEGRGWQHHGRTVGDAGKVTEDHAEAVVEWDGNAEPVILRKSHALANDVAVVEDAVVGQDNPLGEPRGAARVLYIDRVVEREPFTPLDDFVHRDIVCLFQELPPRVHAVVRDVPKEDCILEEWELLARYPAGLGLV